MSSSESIYSNGDPRSKLASGKAGPGSRQSSAFGASHYVHFKRHAAQIVEANSRTWLARGQNFIVAYTEAKPGAVLTRMVQADEYVLISDDPLCEAVITTDEQKVAIEGNRISFIPPGNSSILLPGGGIFVRLFTTCSPDLMDLCINSEGYAERQPHLPDFKPWPKPPSGWRVRSYSLDVPPQPGRFGRIWRCTTFMVNVLEPAGPRDAGDLSPHHHDDFEQGSLALKGSYVHHLRCPWTANGAEWRPDEHEICPAPSLAVIPPHVIHTSAALAPVDNRLVDIFSPPRHDFSAMEGWVLNADDYPALS